MSVSSFDSLNSAIILQYGNNDKMSIAGTIILIMIMIYMIIAFNCFQISLRICKKNVAVYQRHINFRKKVRKS